MGSGPNWKQNMLGNCLFKKDLDVRPESVIFSAEMCILQTRTYWKAGTSRNWNSKLKFMFTSITRRMTPFFLSTHWALSFNLRQFWISEFNMFRICLLPELWSLKYQKWPILCTFCWIQQNISSGLGKKFKCICKVLFGPFRKYYGLRTSELPLAKCQHLKTQHFGISLLTQKFLCLPTISHKQLSPKPINHTIFCNKSVSSLRT